MPSERLTAFAPGRVNLIGEHTDYNDGLCLPFAIDRGVRVSADALARGSEIVAHARDLSEDDCFELGEETLSPGPPGWRRFVRGAAAELRRDGIELRPCRLEITGDVPRGAGLGSSAALSIALSLALCAAAGAEPPHRPRLARLCSRIENDWCGARTGLLDQVASLYGEAGHAIRIDMRGPRVAPVELDLGGHVLATLDSGAPRSLAASGYNERREECRKAARELGVASLRDLGGRHEDVRAAVAALREPLGRRVRHVVTENERVDRTVDALGRGDLAEVGRLLDSSHASLRDDYEVSVPEVERAVEACKRSGALGARIVGGGFGGSVLALFPPGWAPSDGAVRVQPGPGARLL
jgi:galactokinase